LQALDPPDRALWGAAFYAGLRRGEIAALRWEDIDFEHGVIRVARSYDTVSHVIVSTKSDAGCRTIPLIQELRRLFGEHRLATGRREGLVFGVTETTPFTPTAVRARALRRWKAASVDSIKLHECRHTYASLLIASGVNRKELATYLGHAQVSTSEDIYGHLFPGHERHTADRLDTYLAQP
jgi:integrase